MFKIFKKSKNLSVLFIISALLALIFCGGVYLFFKANFYYKILLEDRPKSNFPAKDKYYLNKDYSDKDPFITKNPSLKDMLAGPIISPADPSQGYDTNPVVIVEFADYECVFCHAQEQELKKLVQKYKYQVRLIWKDYPEDNKDTVSFQAAVAARCAQEQDKFWPYHDFLFDNSNNLNQKTFLRIANLLNLDIDIFQQCLQSEQAINKVRDNILEANALDINGVPFVYINDQEIMGQASLADLEKIINIEINKR